MRRTNELVNVDLFVDRLLSDIDIQFEILDYLPSYDGSNVSFITIKAEDYKMHSTVG